MFDPVKRAEILRNSAFKNGKFLIAKVGGSEQEPDPNKLFHDYFRYKDYIKNEAWLKTSLKNVWSQKFLGVHNNEKILEFQNPAYSAGFRMKDDPRNWNRVFTLQLAACNYSCSYCYVPKELNSAKIAYAKYFSAKEILDKLEEAQIKYKSEKNTNVIRLSGGEIGIAPEIIINVYNEIEKRGMSDRVYIWCDTNLSVLKYFEAIEDDLKNVMKKKNIGIVGCFKGVNPSHFELMTGASRSSYDEQFKVAKFLIGIKSDFYVYLPSLLPGNKTQIEEQLMEFIINIRKINKNLPPRTELLSIKDYPATIVNKKIAIAEGRTIPVCNQRMVFDVWYNKLMPKLYPKEANKYYCQVPL